MVYDSLDHVCTGCLSLAHAIEGTNEVLHPRTRPRYRAWYCDDCVVGRCWSCGICTEHTDSSGFYLCEGCAGMPLRCHINRDCHGQSFTYSDYRQGTEYHNNDYDYSYDLYFWVCPNCG